MSSLQEIMVVRLIRETPLLWALVREGSALGSKNF